MGTASQNFLLILDVIIKKQPYKLFSHVSHLTNCPISSRNVFESTLLLLPLLSKEELSFFVLSLVLLSQALTSEVICSLSSGHLLLLQSLLCYFTAKLTFIAFYGVSSHKFIFLLFSEANLSELISAL